MKNALLLVIDMQNGFFDKRNSWNVKGADLIVSIIIDLCLCFPKDNILFTKFVNLNLRNPKTKKSKFLYGSKEIEIIEPLQKFVQPKNIFNKHGYSVLTNKRLLERIKKNNKLYICGLEADACVLFTIADAYDKVLNFQIVIDAIAGFGIFKNSNNFETFCNNHFGKRTISSRDLK